MGVCIYKVNRTNTTANLIPCKMHEVLKKPGWVMYKLYSQHDVIITIFTADDLVNILNVWFPALENTIPDTLADISMIRRKEDGHRGD